MKRYVIIFVFFVFFFLVPAAVTGVTGETDWKEMESRLPETSGKERIEILVELTKHYSGRAPKKALTYGTEALELLPKFPDPRQQVVLFNALGYAHRKRNNLEEARKYLRQARESAKEIGAEKEYADALVNMSLIYYDEGDYDRSIDNLSRALNINEKLRNREGIARVFKTTGSVYFKMGDHSRALECFLKAAKIYENLGNKKKIASIYISIGAVNAVRGNDENALIYFKKALDICKEIEDKRLLAFILHNISVIHRKRKELPEALAHAKQSLNLREELGERNEIASTMALVGLIYRDQNNHPTALRYFTKGLEISKAIKEPEYIAGISVYIASIMRKKGRYADALSLLKQAEAIAAEIKALENQREAAKELAETYTAMKNHQKALEYHKKYKEFHDTLFNENNSKKIAELQTRYDSEKKDKEIQLLKKNEEIQQLNLERQKSFTRFFIIISLLVVIVAGMFYARYRLKTKANRALTKEIAEHKQTVRELRRSEKMETVGILADGIAHDFNNIQTVVIGYLDMIKMQVQNDKPLLRMVRSVEKSSQKAAVLAGKFLTLSKTDWGTRQKLDINDVLKSTAHHHPEMKPLLETVSLAPQLHPINGDERQLRELFYNLLKNADEAVSKPEAVIINAENITLDPENDLSINGGNYVNISITDNGKGIPPEHLDKIFDPYFSTKAPPNPKGMGLGLPLCSAIVQKHKGHISVKSVVGKGTDVTIYLPAFKGENE